MTLFVANLEEQKLTHQLRVIQKETSKLIGNAYRQAINVKPFVTIFNEIGEQVLNKHSQLLRNVIIKAKIGILIRIQKEIRKKLFQTAPVESPIDQGTNPTGFGQMHRYSTNFDIRLAEICLGEWTEVAKKYNVDIREFQKVIADAKVLADSFVPVEKTDFHDRYIRLFYVHYLNLFTNKIIHKVALEIINQHAKSLLENPKLKDHLSPINDTKRWLLKRLPSDKTFLSPVNQERAVLNLLTLAKEKENQIIN